MVEKRGIIYQEVNKTGLVIEQPPPLPFRQGSLFVCLFFVVMGTRCYDFNTHLSFLNHFCRISAIFPEQSALSSIPCYFPPSLQA